MFPPLVWPVPRSLATTSGISFDVFSSPYLDVSVQAVPPAYLWIQYAVTGSSPAGLPHSEIRGSMPAFGSPRLIADRCVLLRLPAPRHSPCTLCSLTIVVHFDELKIILEKITRYPKDTFYSAIIVDRYPIKCFPYITTLLYHQCSLFGFQGADSPLARPLEKPTLASPSRLFHRAQPLTAACLLEFARGEVEGREAYAIRDRTRDKASHKFWWAQVDSNHRPRAYQARALTT